MLPASFPSSLPSPAPAPAFPPAFPSSFSPLLSSPLPPPSSAASSSGLAHGGAVRATAGTAAEVVQGAAAAADAVASGGSATGARLPPMDLPLEQSDLQELSSYLAIPSTTLSTMIEEPTKKLVATLLRTVLRNAKAHQAEAHQAERERRKGNPQWKVRSFVVDSCILWIILNEGGLVPESLLPPISFEPRPEEPRPEAPPARRSYAMVIFFAMSSEGDGRITS